MNLCGMINNIMDIEKELKLIEDPYIVAKRLKKELIKKKVLGGIVTFEQARKSYLIRNKCDPKMILKQKKKKNKDKEKKD